MVGILISKVALVGAWKWTAEVVLSPQVFVQVVTEGLDEAVVDLDIMNCF